MSQIIRTIPVLAVILIFVAFIHVDLYYSNFHITIHNWISLDEVMTLFMDDLTRLVFIFLIILICIYSIIKLRELAYGDGHLDSKKAPIGILGYAIYVSQFVILGGLIWYIIRERPLNGNWVFNLPIAFIIFLIISFFILFEMRLNRFLGCRLDTMSLFFILVIATALVNAVSTSLFKLEDRLKFQTAVLTLKDGRNIDSLIFIGKSKDYYFLYKNRRNPKGDSTLVVSEQCVRNINFGMEATAFISEADSLKREPNQFIVIENCQ